MFDNSLNSALAVQQETSKITRYKKDIDDMKNKILLDLSDDLVMIGYFEEEVAKYSVDEIKRMTNADINEKFVYNGEPILFGDMKKTKEIILYTREMQISSQKFDDELAKMEEEIQKSQEEINKFLEENGSLTKLVRKQLIESIDKAVGEDKELKEKMLEAFDDGTTLIEFTKWIKNEFIDNIFDRRYIADVSESLVHRYLKVANKLNLPFRDMPSIESCVFFDLEKFDSKYKDVAGIFFINYINYCSYLTHSKKDRVKLINAMSIGVNIKQLYTNTPETDTETFRNAVINILEYFLENKESQYKRLEKYANKINNKKHNTNVKEFSEEQDK